MLHINATVKVRLTVTRSGGAKEIVGAEGETCVHSWGRILARALIGF